MKKVFEAVFSKRTNRIPPVWFMRQAGRHLPQYQDLKKEFSGSFLDLLTNKDFIKKATMQPVSHYDLDAAIIFSDILLIPYILGMTIDYEGGARVANPLASEVGWGEPDYSKLNPLYQGLHDTRLELEQDKSLIGFCPAPWTIFCYMADGKSKDGRFPNAIKLLNIHEKFVKRTLYMLAEVVAEHLMLQIRFGADIGQIFDTWAETMPEEVYDGFYQGVLQRVRLGLGNVPLIYFGKNVRIRDFMVEIFDCISIGPDISLEQAKKIQKHVCVQGNLSPELAAKGGEESISQVRRILEELSHGPFVFNLGHGVLPQTPVSNLEAIVKEVRGWQ